MIPDLSVVIVSWNVRDLLRECLCSIQAGSVTIVGAGQAIQAGHLPVEVIVVDNLSQDGTPAMLRESFPWVRLVEPGRNTGFSRGNNLGIQASRGRLVLILNPDTRIIGDAIPRMAAYMDAHPVIGVLGPQLLNQDGSVQSSRRRFPTLWTAIFESTWLQGLAPRRILDHYYVRDRPDDAVQPVDWVQGAAMLVRRTVFDQVGGFDEAYFMYSEELDWQRRISQTGWEIVYYPEAQIVHLGGKSSDQAVAQRHIDFQTSKVRYFRTHHGPLVGFVVRTVLLANYVSQMAIEAAKWLLGHKRALRRDRIVAYWQVVRSGLRG